MDESLGSAVAKTRANPGLYVTNPKSPTDMSPDIDIPESAESEATRTYPHGMASPSRDGGGVQSEQ